MNKWGVEIKGHQFDIEYLNENQDSESWFIAKEGDMYNLESLKFKDILSDEEVMVKASKLMTQINGLAKIMNPDFRPVELGDVYRLDENNRKTVFKHVKSELRFRSSLGVEKFSVAKGKLEEIPIEKPDLFEPYNALSDMNELVENALIIFSKSKLSWGDLYNIQEIIADSGYISEVLEKCGISKSELSKFKQTSQSFEAVGEEARHRKKKFTKPDNPMSKIEAGNLIRKLLTKWINIQL